MRGDQNPLTEQGTRTPPCGCPCLTPGALSCRKSHEFLSGFSGSQINSQPWDHETRGLPKSSRSLCAPVSSRQPGLQSETPSNTYHRQAAESKGSGPNSNTKARHPLPHEALSRSCTVAVLPPGCSGSHFPVTPLQCSYFLYIAMCRSVAPASPPPPLPGRHVRTQTEQGPQEPAGSAPPWLLLQAPSRIPALPSLGHGLCVT